MSSTRVGTKRVYDFSEGSRDMRDLLGGKGANVAEMTRLGLPVPKGFTITTRTCMDYLDGGHAFPAGLDEEVSEHLATLEDAVGKRLGDPENPLLVSVRSGAKFSMPGMMDTVLNLGLNDQSVEGLAARTGNPRFAYDSYRRFIQMFGDVVAEVKKEHFENALSAMKAARGVEQDVELTADDLRELVRVLQGHLPRAPRRGLPAGAARPARRRHPRGLRVVGQPPRPRLPAPQPHRPRPGHRGQRAADGVRQHRLELGHGRRLHPQQRDRREGRALRRLPDQRPGRGRRGRHPHPAPARRAEGRAARGVRPADLDDGPAGADLPQHAGRRVHHRGRRALHAPDAQRQAQRAGHGADRRRHGRRGARERGRSPAVAGRPRPGTPAAAAAARPARRPRAARPRRRRVAGRRDRRDRLHRRRGRAARAWRASR